MTQTQKTATAVIIVGCVFSCTLIAEEQNDGAQYFVQKSTWAESMLASREVYIQNYTGYVAELWPWYTTGTMQAKGFDDPLFPEEKVDLKAKDKNGKALWTKNIRWQDGKVQYSKGGANAVMYLYRVINSDKAITVTASLGSDDGIEVWLNGKKLLSRNISRGAKPDQERVDLPLKAGANDFLMKIHNRTKGDTGFYFDIFQNSTAVQLWGAIAKKYPVQCKSMLRDLGGDQAMKWFDGAEGVDIEKKMITSVFESLESVRSKVEKGKDKKATFEEEYGVLAVNNVSNQDRRWLDLYDKCGSYRDELESLVINKRYLILPVNNNAPNRRITVVIEGKKVREFDIRLGSDDPKYWVWLDVSEFRGKRATLLMDNKPGYSKELAAIYLDDKLKNAETFYKEPARQQFHFSSRRGWNNDSNGLVYYKGEYHLYYQHNPYGTGWGNMHWGHAVSTDLVHWKELPIAIYPHEFGDWAFSGSAVVDYDNTAGFKTGNEDVIVAAYTSTGRGEVIVYSNDRGRTFTEYSGNPVVKHKGRDPKVLWYEPGKHWVMAVYDERPHKGIAFYSSTDLKDWKFNSWIGGFYECPEMFELPVDGDKSKTKWVVYGGDGDYMIGEFDGKTFTPDGGKIKFHYGNCFYASQTFGDIPEKDGRRIQIAWGRIGTPGPFNQCMLFPVSLTLRTTTEGIRMFVEPVAEIKNIHGKKHTWKNRTLAVGQDLLAGLSGELFHIRGSFKVDSTADMSFNIRGREVRYDAASKQLIGRKPAKMEPQNGVITLEILVDRNSIEIFGNNGRVYMPIGGRLDENNKKLKLSAKTGDVKVELLEIYELKSAWK